jgi:hypothetical protein
MHVISLLGGQFSVRKVFFLYLFIYLFKHFQHLFVFTLMVLILPDFQKTYYKNHHVLLKKGS